MPGEPALTADHLGVNLADAVIRLRRALRPTMRAEMHDRPLSTAEVELLVLVLANPGINVAAAARELRTAPNTVSTLVRPLLVTGLLRRELDHRDRRVALLTVTPAGVARLERWRTLRAELLDRALVDFSAADRGTLAAALPLLYRLSDAFESVPASGTRRR